MMKKLLASASILALSSVAVSAADLPVKAPHVLPPPIPFTWTGCYVGLHAGGGVMKDSNTHDQALSSISSIIAIEEGLNQGSEGTGTGGIAGGQAGCNYQDGNWVVGVEAEGWWSGIRTNTGRSITEGIVTLSDFQHTKNKSDFDIAARAGIAFDRTLVYGKAGWVWGNFNFDSGISFCELGCETFTTSQSGSLNGLLVGLGVEHAFTWAPNWTVKLEYDYIRYGSKFMDASFFFDGFPIATGSASQHVDKQIVKVGFNYLFNFWGPAPVVAKY
jgi:outer membrane immunogenic protein